jgi:MFS family permease
LADDMAIYLLVLLCALNHTAFMGSRVLVSLYALHLGANQTTIGMLIALYAVCPTLLAVHIGKLADRIGPRPPMLMGTLGIAIALLLPWLFPGLVTLYFMALLIGMSFNFYFVTLMGIAGGIGGEENRVKNYALLSLAFSAAGFFGSILAGFSIDHLGHLSTFLLLSTFTVIPFLLIWFRPEIFSSTVKREATGAKKKALDLLRIPPLRNAVIASGILATAWDLFQFYMPVYGYAIGLSASAIGTIIGIFALAAFVIRFILPRLTKIAHEAEILTYAIFVAAFAFMLCPFFKNFYALASISFLLGLGVGCGMPLSMSLIYALSPRERVSESAGLRLTANNLSHLVIPLLFGGMGTVFGHFPVFFSNAVMLVGGGVLLRRGSTQGRQP